MAASSSDHARALGSGEALGLRPYPHRWWLRRSGRSEPPGQRFRESGVGSVSDPGNVSVGPDQHGSGSGDLAKYRKLARTGIFSVDELDPVRPWSDVEAAGLTEVEQHRPGVVQQLEDSPRLSAVTRSRSGMRRPSSGCPSPRS